MTIRHVDMVDVGMRLGATDVVLEAREVRRPQRILGDQTITRQVIDPVGAGHETHPLEVFLMGFRGM